MFFTQSFIFTGAAKMTIPDMKRARGGVELGLAVWEGNGGTVLCVHGLTANCRAWDTIARSLAPRYRVIAMDLRGRGVSGRPRRGYSVEHHCRDIRKLLDGLGLERVVLVGHSLGAVICLAFAAKFPLRVERLVLVDGGGKLNEEQTARVFAAIRPSLDRLGRVFQSLDAYLDLMKMVPFLQPWTEAMETYWAYDMEEAKGGIRSRIRPAHIAQEIANLQKTDVTQYYTRVACPTLILRATEGMLATDDILLPEGAVVRMLSEIPDCRCINIEGTNHYSIMFHPSETRDQAIESFLK
jgi:pimeloyl-ACP methyl ester carboxylesterase